MILLTKLLKGSISSASPSGEKTLQGCFSIMGASLGSTLIRWASASSRMLLVVVFTLDTLDGESWSRGLWAMTRCVSGDIKVALVVSGTASLLMGVVL